ncbi:hypothetical protein B0H10DRAFT_2211086 [Mycena sp. CBHHK59/15]|nr:hypothetical protein B0H10DRAFT_2211086 [Mycena sp. CBHHK59/15]
MLLCITPHRFLNNPNNAVSEPGEDGRALRWNARFMVVSSMFYSRTEQTLRVGYWYRYTGSFLAFLAPTHPACPAQIISGFISTLHIKTKAFESRGSGS